MVETGLVKYCGVEKFGTVDELKVLERPKSISNE